MTVRTGVGLAIALVAATALACRPPDIACTEIAAPSGVSVTVSPDLATSVARLTLELCFGGRCREVPVELFPGSRTVPQDCPSDLGPDTTCSAVAVPDGTLVGFGEVADLPTGTVEVAAVLTRGSRTLTYDKITVQATTVYPNGRQCPGEGNQATVRVTPAGLIG